MQNDQKTGDQNTNAASKSHNARNKPVYFFRKLIESMMISAFAYIVILSVLFLLITVNNGILTTTVFMYLFTIVSMSLAILTMAFVFYTKNLKMKIKEREEQAKLELIREKQKDFFITSNSNLTLKYKVIKNRDINNDDDYEDESVILN